MSDWKHWTLSADLSFLSFLRNESVQIESSYVPSKNITCVHTFVSPQLSQQPDPHPSTTPSRVGHSPAANCATEPSTTHTHGPLTHTVRITCTRLTHMPSSPTGSGTGAPMSILSWAPSREAARPPHRPLRQDPSTPRNCSPIPPSPLRAAREARAAPRATAPRFPQRHRTVRYRNGWRGLGSRRGRGSKFFLPLSWKSLCFCNFFYHILGLMVMITAKIMTKSVLHSLKICNVNCINKSLPTAKAKWKVIHQKPKMKIMRLESISVF